MALSSARSYIYICQKSLIQTCTRSISTTCVQNSKKSFRKFPYFDRGTAEFNEQQRTNPDPNLPSFRYGRVPGYFDEKHNLVPVPEMIPELIVPDLTGFELKPYVSFRVPIEPEPAFTAKDLFYSVYAEKIEADYEQGRLDENGMPLEPSENELLTAEQARDAALKLGADMFTDTENIVNDSEWMKEQPKMEYN
ncbi:39S ribosomal protein L41, mitochondrial [Thrips palmi]|uniref:39S ribosomal protein L41, mitochondrial n=1 Tax=Thrips palmi TaxID=161013 RepID=A0A6P8YA70_THRPL|nr:39S ribosomal protein L41, mitochondrial [Thrips palmi]